MTDTTWKRDEPDSPCKQICVIHRAAGICVGCHRTADEVRNWASLTRDERVSILAKLPGRGHMLRRRRGRRQRS